MELLQVQRYIIFFSDQLKSRKDTEPNRFCFLLTLWPSAKVETTDSGIKWQRSWVPINKAGKKESGSKVYEACPTLMSLLTKVDGQMDNGRLAKHDCLHKSTSVHVPSTTYGRGKKLSTVNININLPPLSLNHLHYQNHHHL